MLTFNKPDVEQFFRTFAVQNFAVSPDEKQVIFSTNLNGKFNLWAIDLPGSFPYPLTFIDQSCQTIAYDKQNRFVIVGFDHDGNENTQLYAMPLQGGQLLPLRKEEGVKHFFTSLSKDGERLYYSSSRENPTFLNSYCYDLSTGEEKLILEGKAGTTFLVDVSSDEKSFVYAKIFANTYILGYLQKDGENFCLTPETDQQHQVSDITYYNESEIYFLTNFGADFAYLAHYNINTREFKKIIALEKEDFTRLKLDKEKKCLYIVSNRGVEDTLYRYELLTEKIEHLMTPTSVIEKISLAESGNLYLLGRSATSPFNLYQKRIGQEWQELTNYRVPGVSEEELVEPDVIRYASYDGLEIEALYFKAKEDVTNGHMILWPHGGPQSAERKMFRALFQFLVNGGYSIFAPNFRGSTGYGLEFMKLVEGDWGHGPRLDNIFGLEYMIQNGFAERDKIFVMGGSYGGYMTLLLAGRHAEYFKACIDIFGPCNLFTFLDSVPEHWKPAMKQWLGDPVEDKERLTVDSPITYLEQMVKPMLVIQGANDPRVVKAESDQIVAALQEQGLDVEYLVLDDEGHGFSKKENEMKVYRRVLEFLDRHL